MTYYDILTETNSANTLSQEELFVLFSRAYHLLRESLSELTHSSRTMQHTLIDLGAEVAASIDRNKSIFKRKVEFQDLITIDVKADKLEQQGNYLCLCMDLQAALLADDLERQIYLTINAPVSRRIFELVIIAWLNRVRPYLDMQTAYTRAILAGDLDTRFQLAREIQKFELDHNIDPVRGYSTIFLVDRNMKAIRVIYNKVSKAYSRAVLKLARSQAATQDCITDSLQNGHLGLIRAISSYDHISNARFIGNTKHWIKQSMLFFMKEEANIIKVSSNTWQHYAKLEAIKRKTEIQKGPTTINDLADASGYKITLVESVYSSVEISQVKSLDNQITTEGFTLMNLATDEGNEEALPLNVSDLICKLPIDLAKIVCLFYGLLEHMPQNVDVERLKFERAKQILAATVI